MLQQFVHIIIISCICCIWGLPLLLLGNIEKKERSWYRSFAGFLSFLFLSGLLTLSFLASLLCLFVPLRFTYLLCLTIILMLFLFFSSRHRIIALTNEAKYKSFPFPSAGTALLLVCLFLFLALSCLKPNNGDTQIYHLQIIQWTSRYKAVPGIANLFPRIGLGSAWFGLISLFHLPIFKNENYSYLNASLTIWFFIWLFSSWHHHFTRLPCNRSLFLFHFLILVYALYDWELFRDAANSTNYDLIVTATTLLAVSFLLEGIWEPANDKSFSIIFLIVAFSAIAFKFSGIFILLPVAYYLFHHRSPARILLPLCLFLTILAPAFIKNYIVTGYPLYPLSLTLGSPDWRVPKEMVDLLHNYITLSNRFYSQDFVNSYIFKEQHAFWFPIWFSGILWQHRIAIILIASSVILLFTNTGLPPGKNRFRQCIILLLLMTAGWLFTAPSPRFGYGVLLPAASLPVSIWLGPVIRTRWYSAALWITTAAICLYLPVKILPLIRQPSVLLRPQSVDTPAFKIIRNGSIAFHLPGKLYGNNDARCYNTDLPCICEENPWLQPRGSSLSDGFRMYPHPDSVFIQNYNY